jgi:glycosyltransferase involved in cell wall biosynthesis
MFVNSIFPNPVEPLKGNFILKNIAAYPYDVEVKVIAPVPFFLGVRRGKHNLSIARKDAVTIGNKSVEVYRPRFLLLPRNLLRAFVPYLEYISILSIMKHIHKEWKIDLLHANFASPDGIAAAYMARKMEIPLVITEHQAALQTFVSIPYLRRQMLSAYHQAKCVVCVSQFTANILKNTDPSLQNLKVIPNGVDFSRFNLRSITDTPSKLIYIGYLVQHKGIHVLLQAIAILKQQGIFPSLSIIGSGIYGNELKLLCNKLDLNSQVHFLGEKNAAEVANLLPQHDVMIHPSFIESFGIVMVEALAAGLPVLSTFNGGAEDIISSEVGMLVPINNPKALAEGIIKLFANWHSYKPQALRDYAFHKYGMSIVAGQTIAVYRDVIHE